VVDVVDVVDLRPDVNGDGHHAETNGHGELVEVAASNGHHSNGNGSVR
jgi:hypothetical protein